MASLHNVVMRADVPRAIKGTVSESYPHLIFENFTTPLGLRLVKILKHLFPPRDAAARRNAGNRVITFGMCDSRFPPPHWWNVLLVRILTLGKSTKMTALRCGITCTSGPATTRLS